MARYKEHCADCKAELGNDWSVVHRWLDELYKYFGEKHRSFRHHRGGVEVVRKKWGDEAAKAAEIHIRKDFFGRVPETDWEVEQIMDGVIHLPEPPKPPRNDDDECPNVNEDVGGVS